MKKHILLLLISLLSLSGLAQTQSTLPAGSKPYGNQLYIDTQGRIWSGLGSAKFRVVDTKQRVDSLLTVMQTDINSKIPLTDKAAANGVATLDAGGKVPLAQTNDALLGSVNYQGNYNATTNAPALPTATGNKGKYYVVATGGTTQGLTFVAGDWIISNGVLWQKVDNNNAVASVAGRTGAVALTKTDVGLANVDNTSDLLKPLSTAASNGLAGKISTVGINQLLQGQLSIKSGDATTPVIKQLEISSASAALGESAGIAFQNDRAGVQYDGIYQGLKIYKGVGYPLIFSSGSTIGAGEFARFDATGNLGIGTFAPTAKIDVVGTGKFSGALTAGTITNNAIAAPYAMIINQSNLTAPSLKYGGIRWMSADAFQVAKITTGTDLTGLEYLGLGASTDNKLVIHSNGKVGIGTLTPTEALDVTGNAKFSGDIIYGSIAGGTYNPLSGPGISFAKNTDYGKIYFESTDNTSGNSNLIFESGDDVTGSGGPTEGFLFRKFNSSGSVTSDLLRINPTDFKYKTFDVFHTGNFTPANYLPLTGGALTGIISSPQYDLKHVGGTSQRILDYTNRTANQGDLNLYSQYGNNTSVLGLTLTGEAIPSVIIPGAVTAPTFNGVLVKGSSSNTSATYDNIINYGLSGQQANIKGYSSYGVNYGAGLAFYTNQTSAPNLPVQSLMLNPNGDATFASSVTASSFKVIPPPSSDNREIRTYYRLGTLPPNELVTGHEYTWYNDSWQVGATRGAATDIGDFVIQDNNVRKMSLTTAGAATFTSSVSATAFINTSDIRLKNVVDSTFDVTSLKPIAYTWKSDTSAKPAVHYGYSAQEVQKLMPDAITVQPSGTLSVNYIEVLVAKVKELEDRLKVLEAEKALQ
jgi:hypothetical protein